MTDANLEDLNTLAALLRAHGLTAREREVFDGMQMWVWQRGALNDRQRARVQEAAGRLLLVRELTTRK
jgi:hypothetical protein